MDGNFEGMYPMSKEHMKRYQTKMKTEVDNSRRLVVKEAIGSEYDLVFYRNKDKTSKWEPDFNGPGRIVSVNKRTGNYTICSPEDRAEILTNNAPSHC